MTPTVPAKLALADGLVLTGTSVGARGETGGELCFNTSMSGYQEILTDPSYVGQLMMMTYPHIGNYGAFEAASESDGPKVAGLVVREFCEGPSNHRAEEPLAAWMQRHGLVGISGIDTRQLVRHIREKGVMNAVVSSEDLDDDSLVAKAKAVPSMAGLELASRVSVAEPEDFVLDDGASGAATASGKPVPAEAGSPRIAVYDYGVKRNILRSFAARGAQVRLFPHDTPLAEVMEWEPDGLFFSNGPGDPRAMPDAIATVKEAIAGGLPLFGICLGHQLMALAEGIEVFKMKVGHRGANQPVINRETGHVEITTQNHGFAVDPESITPEAAAVHHRNLNDGSVEGLRFARFPGFSVQYHPEACPGPHDSHYLFDEFLALMRGEGAGGQSPVAEPASGAAQ